MSAYSNYRGRCAGRIIHFLHECCSYSIASHATIGEEKIMHAAKASSPLQMARERLVSLIREAGRLPVERDCLYNPVRVFENVPVAPS